MAGAKKMTSVSGVTAQQWLGSRPRRYSRNLSGNGRHFRISERLQVRLMSSQGSQGAAAKPARDHASALRDLEKIVTESPSPERVSAKLAQILNVSRNEVAMLRVEKGSLRFVFPPELRAAGIIPMSSSAVAARTLSTGVSLLSNSFARVKHVSLFESVKLGSDDDDSGSGQMPIQKIMSAPISDSAGKVIGVVQISRKGLDSSLAGTDFSNDDLKRLEQAAVILAQFPFMAEDGPLPEDSR